MGTDTLTHKDLAATTGVSVTTIKSYRKKFPEFFLIAGHGKPLRFKKGADKLCLRIKELFEKSLSTKQIRGKLLIEFESVKENQHLSVTTESKNNSSLELEKLTRITMQMMNGMAGLVTAQAKAEHRLGKIEKGLFKLIEKHDSNNSDNEHLISEIKNIFSSATGLPQSERVTAKKLITIKKDHGDSSSYTLESDSSQIYPENDFLELPVVIHSENGDFLGMPGKPGQPFTLTELVELVTTKKALNSNKIWRKEGREWILSFKSPTGPLHELFFQRTKTPKGNIVSFFNRLDINSESKDQTFLLSFFREVRDLIDET
ncbi:hypothetical protein SAMN05660337_0556 [Maridesulfovibrio ferrireducens]|uniref:HTH merR-type domain-containing protein n=1 Tax=Maridesulfovibrio ferrireducens TaxID=246191 RepID=A0A1G9C5X9_9BACT|nr:helix-turn-helix domain-containing protein [Maridesulfovibrio ferrireducens]SDK47088.1 hypothetical protein SAMN05660337_0556 [Maridesulfovibrio ferrireducens]